MKHAENLKFIDFNVRGTRFTHKKLYTTSNICTKMAKIVSDNKASEFLRHRVQIGIGLRLDKAER